MPAQELQFKVVESFSDIEAAPNLVVLVEHGWDDWFTFNTMYTAYFYDELEERQRIGSVKIGKFQMGSLSRPDIPANFAALEELYFSLGQDDEYYDNLNKIGESFRKSFLSSMNDVAADLTLWQRAAKERVTKVSLLRSVSRTEIEGQFHRITQGGARLTKFNFSYTAPKREAHGSAEVKMTFEVEPESSPPSNIHVIIGRNGVGKTHTLNLMTKSLVAKRSIAARSGQFATLLSRASRTDAPFSNLVSVCFSAFDGFALAPDELEKNGEVEFSYIGLRRIRKIDGKSLGTKSPASLATEFVNSAIECSIGSRANRWRSALITLESDPIFATASITGFIGKLTRKEHQEEAKAVFKKLSSGHQIVLLSITRLVESVEEMTLVLLDEPEGHLHPPLLSAFIRALSNLLTDRNGVAIIATHSPVVLQEVPQDCVWKLQRSGHAAKAERLECQTFGENVGILTREVFGFEVTDAGFHRLLREAARDSSSYQQAVRKFGGALGAEARAILRVMFLRKEAENEESS
ncbi:AAA family ATPase [Roseibacillus persicicus]|uniref:ATPase AAA-type core domain-containing protein n=1 Tax=Roseibacillus persicicus TaxID=454148 RepID=A0A918TMA5_9BACT|nr:AAA family ATPase [Roseibacillus persicicus]GHC54377.1 hypothetical protein GCM10007100_20980 [Roseibacillus persicicus]